MTVVTRFAPSPTGFLHIGGARTALFNWLFARHHGGTFLLRIEDTDRARSTDAAVAAIFDGLRWLGLNWDGDAVSQFSGAERHGAVARQLLAEGKAYHCYCKPEELAEMREQARKEGRSMLYDGRWRDRDPADAPAGVDPVIRLKAPLDGETVIRDSVQGEVRVGNQQMDDMVLLRANGTPTYMLAVVVDDHDMGVTHVIRGDDHLTNAFRQVQLYRAMGWDEPQFAHIPLIHGADGAKMSKRHGALGVDYYRDAGYLPEALRNYLLRLGWSHGDDEIISTEQAIQWFDLDAVGRAPARFDEKKLTQLNAHYLRQADDELLTESIVPILAGKLQGMFAEEATIRLRKGIADLKQRSKTLVELSENAEFYAVRRPLCLSAKAAKLLDAESLGRLRRFRAILASLAEWSVNILEETGRRFSEAEGVKLGTVAQPLRAALTGKTNTPGIFDVMEVLGRDETLGRLDDALLDI
jgi:glutamyl-tRNA synthetase